MAPDFPPMGESAGPQSTEKEITVSTNTTGIDERLRDALIERFCNQATDLVNECGIPPLEVANLLIDTGTSLALLRAPREDVAAAFRDRAEYIETMEPMQHDS